MTEEEIQLSRGFQLMWGKYPEPVRLIRRDMTIVAGNECYLGLQGQTGIKCSSVGTPEMHRGCLAAKALKTGEAKTIDYEMFGTPVTSYWIPLDGRDDYFIHFSSDMMKAVAARKTTEN